MTESYSSDLSQPMRGSGVRRLLLWIGALTLVVYSAFLVVSFLGLRAMSNNSTHPAAVYNVQYSGWSSIYMPTCPGERVSDIWIITVLPQPNSTLAARVHFQNPATAGEFTYDLQQLLRTSPVLAERSLEYPAAHDVLLVHLQVRTTKGREARMYFHPDGTNGWQQSPSSDNYSTNEGGLQEIRDALQCAAP